MKAAERQRQVRNEYHRQAARKWQQLGNERQADYDRNQKKLERLKLAQGELRQALTTFTEFEKEVNRYPFKLQRDNFKGTLRGKFDQEVKKIATTVKTETNLHQQNMARLDAEIRKRELEQAQLASSITSAYSMANGFLSLIF